MPSDWTDPCDVPAILDQLHERRRRAAVELAALRPRWPHWRLWISNTGHCYATRTLAITPRQLRGVQAITVAANNPAELQRKLTRQLEGVYASWRPPAGGSPSVPPELRLVM